MKRILILLLVVAVFSAFCFASPKGGKGRNGGGESKKNGTKSGGKKGESTTVATPIRVLRDADDVPSVGGNVTAPVENGKGKGKGQGQGQVRSAQAKLNRVEKSQGKGKTQGGGNGKKDRAARDLNAIMFQNEAGTDDTTTSNNSKGKGKGQGGKSQDKSQKKGGNKSQSGSGGKKNRVARDLNALMSAGAELASSMGNAATNAATNVANKVGNWTSAATRQIRNRTRSITGGGAGRQKRDIQTRPFLFPSSTETSQHPNPGTVVHSAGKKSNKNKTRKHQTTTSATPLSTPQAQFQYLNDSNVIVLDINNASWAQGLGLGNETLSILPFNFSNINIGGMGMPPMNAAVMPPNASDFNNIFQGIAGIVGERFNVIVNSVVEAINQIISRISPPVVG